MNPPRVYFFAGPELHNLQDDIIILAEGLKALGIPYYSSADYWLQSEREGDYLIRKTPDVHPDDCDIVVFSYTWFNWVLLGEPRPLRRDFPEGIFKKGRRYRTVYMDINDGMRTVSWEPEFRNFDVILRAKYNERTWNPGNLRPWVMGLSNRMLKMTAGSLPFGERKRTVLVNFGASHPFPHGARVRSHKKFDPVVSRILEIDASRDDLSVAPGDAYDRVMWEQTNHRHSRSYYERLGSSQAVSCFCGELIPPMPWHDPNSLLLGGNRAKLRRGFYQALGLLDPRHERIVQWDSWRFWESMAAGCSVFHLDLALYGARLPEMPVNGVHYWGVDLEDPSPTIDRIAGDPDSLRRVALAGREWAMTHYSPAAMARRFLEELEHPLPETPGSA
ncbi:MAG TPA: hypothetical protein VGG34_10870 [Opitutaceae bacterium]|jgi:hypothetical protein